MRTLIAAVLAVLVVAQHASAVVVYDQPSSASGAINVNGNAFDYVGDSAVLAGTDRYITQVDLGTKLFANAGVVPLGLTLELYADMSPFDGLPDDVDPITVGNQYQLLGSSSITQVYTGGGNHVSVFPFSYVQVPDNIIFVVRQDTFDNNFQVLLGPPSIVGDSFNVSGTERIVISSQGNPNFQRANVGGPEVMATIHAVPEPAAVALLGLGGLGLLARYRRRLGA